MVGGKNRFPDYAVSLEGIVVVVKLDACNHVIGSLFIESRPGAFDKNIFVVIFLIDKYPGIVDFLGITDCTNPDSLLVAQITTAINA